MAVSALAPRFEFERLMGKLEWLQELNSLPASSPLFAHGLCDGRCQRKDGSWLRPSTIKHIGMSLGACANGDGTRAFPGIGRLAQYTARGRFTVVIALAHLETVGLICARVRGGAFGIARDHATEYCLTSPNYDIPSTLEPAEHARVIDWFRRA